MTVTTRSAGDLLTAAIFNTKLEAPIVASEIGADAVTTAKILDGNVTAAKLANSAVTPPKLATLPNVHLTNNAGTSIANATATDLTWNTERQDTDTMHSTVTNPERITFTTAGLYQVRASVLFAANATGLREIWIENEAGTILSYTVVTPVSGDRTSLHLNFTRQFTAASWIKLRVRQSSGAALTVDRLDAYTPEFSAAFLSP